MFTLYVVLTNLQEAGTDIAGLHDHHACEPPFEMFNEMFPLTTQTSIATSWLLLPPGRRIGRYPLVTRLILADQVVRGDGTIVEIEAALGPKRELKEFFAQFKDIRMLLLFPMFFSSNYCESAVHVNFEAVR